LWRDRTLIWLAPTRVSWLTLERGRPRIVAKASVEVDPDFGVEPWQGALAALRPEAEKWRRSAVCVTVVLSNHFVRYVLVPASKGLHGAEEAQALARYHFTRVHGERSRGWEVRLGDSRARLPQIASAIDAALLEALRACFPATASPRLVSVQPYLMAAFNRWRDRFASEGAWFLLPEPGRACLALIAGERWLSLQNVRGDYDHPETWADLVARERLRTEAERIPATVLVHAPQAIATPLPGANWKGLVSGPFWPAGVTLPAESHYGAALTAT
jgi:hypothetical protein